MRKLMLVVALAAIAGCGGPSKEQYKAKEAEVAKAKEEAAALDAKIKSLEQQQAALQQQNAKLQQQASTTKSQLETTTAKLSEQSAEYRQLKDRTIRLSERLLFKENSSKLTPEASRSLDAMADAIKQLEGKAVLVAGYTDNTEGGGKTAQTKRWQLSTARATTVANYLAKRGLDPMHVGVAGFGEGRPVAANDTLANKALNRRVEIVLMPQELELGTVEVSPAQVDKK